LVCLGAQLAARTAVAGRDELQDQVGALHHHGCTAEGERRLRRKALRLANVRQDVLRVVVITGEHECFSRAGGRLRCFVNPVLAADFGYKLREAVGGLPELSRIGLRALRDLTLSYDPRENRFELPHRNLGRVGFLRQTKLSTSGLFVTELKVGLRTCLVQKRALGVALRLHV
jgi:hypothetical protein